MKEKLHVGILGGTGMVGQRFISLLENHPWFEGKDLRGGCGRQMENEDADAGKSEKHCGDECK